MNSNDGHLISGEMMKEFKMNPLKFNKNIQDYTEVPPELENAAKKKLNGKDEAYVSLNSGGKLSKYMAKLRREAKNKKTKQRSKNKTAKQSRKKNRK